MSSPVCSFLLKFIRQSEHDSIIKCASASGRLVVEIDVRINVQIEIPDKLPGKIRVSFITHPSRLGETKIYGLCAVDLDIRILKFIEIKNETDGYFVQKVAGNTFRTFFFRE